MGAVFPEQPFDGQVFIDAFRVRWIYDTETNCWMRSGSVNEIPVATELQPGLMSAQLKQVLDGLPEKAGSFGIVTRPLLSVKDESPKPLIRDSVAKVAKDDSGTAIYGQIPADGRNYSIEEYVGKLLRFKTGTLCNKTFLIFTNDETALFLDGDASQAKAKDEFEILEPSRFNPSGVLLGDIVLVSESIDITCVNSDGDPLPQGCNVDKIYADDPDNPPALNFRLNQNFLNNLCVTIPGCEGPRGERGEKGDQGAPGTGDGPTGDQGDPGEDAPLVGDEFAGIKLIELDDIFDTAVVGLELDAANGVLGVIKAKVRTPDDTTPADQVVSTPISRTIQFTNPDTFDYQILMPPAGDPIGESDISLLKYPNKFVPDGENETTVNRIMLTQLIDSIVAFYQGKLAEANDQFNQEIKEYVNNLDSQARTILANLADELARCEFELPIEFCLGISPADCNPFSTASGGTSTTSTAGGFPYPLGSTFFSITGTPTATDLGTLTVLPFAVDVDPDLDFPITFPLQNSQLVQTTLPPGGYVIQWVSGTIRGEPEEDEASAPYIVGSEAIGEGLQAVFTDGTAPSMILQFPVPSAAYNPLDPLSVEAAYRNAPIIEKALPIEITSPDGGTIALLAPVEGISASGSLELRVIKVDLST